MDRWRFCLGCAKWVVVGSFCCGLAYDTVDQRILGPVVEPTQSHVHIELNMEPNHQTTSLTLATTTTPPPTKYEPERG